MEHLDFDIAGRAGVNPARDHVLVGVVGSGNLEVMIERAELDGRCAVAIDTSIHGFAPTWKRVVEDFLARHRLGDVRVSINDGGATPAVVGLRLDQAAAEYTGGVR